jgi:hypothetical protein
VREADKGRGICPLSRKVLTLEDIRSEKSDGNPNGAEK